MSAIKSRALHYSYPNADKPTLQELSFALPDGALTLVTGASGAGKSTLLRTFNGLVPHFSGGTLTGHLTVDGVEPYLQPPQNMGQRVGFVFQDPESQAVMAQVEDEIAFGMEQQGLNRAEMRVRLEEVLDLLGIANLRGRALTTLSGGERQRVAIAAVLALRPPLIVLDEPTSQLDPLAADELFQALVRLNHDLGISIVVAEHRLERVLPYADTMLSLTGAAPLLGTPREVLPRLQEVPPLVEIARQLKWEPLPLTIKEARPFSRRMTLPVWNGESTTAFQQGEVVVRAEGVSVGYHGTFAVRSADFALHAGEIVVLMGRNGAGKSSLLRSLVGLVRPTTGAITVGTLDATRTSTAALCRVVGFYRRTPTICSLPKPFAENGNFPCASTGLTRWRGGRRMAHPLRSSWA